MSSSQHFQLFSPFHRLCKRRLREAASAAQCHTARATLCHHKHSKRGEHNALSPQARRLDLLPQAQEAQREQRPVTTSATSAARATRCHHKHNALSPQAQQTRRAQRAVATSAIMMRCHHKHGSVATRAALSSVATSAAHRAFQQPSC